MGDKQKKIVAQQEAARQAAALSEAKRSMLLMWLCTAGVAFVVLGRTVFIGVKPVALHYILLGVLLLVAIFTTEGYIKVRRMQNDMDEK